jgi:hypothetical protein
MAKDYAGLFVNQGVRHTVRNANPKRKRWQTVLLPSLALRVSVDP